MSSEIFHPAVAAWFKAAFAGPTPCQARAWPAIQAGRHTLIAAPTGSGKTLAAFLAAIDSLVRQAEAGELQDLTQVVYVSPLKALSNDIRRNLELPLSGIREQLRRQGFPDADIRTLVRTGDTPQHERLAMRKRPPHILVTTPESLYILLTSQGGREMLRTTRTVIVDEIHAVAGSKRGSHLALSLERLDALAGARLVRVGLSATQRPIEDVARFLVGAGNAETNVQPDCAIIDTGHARARDLAIEVPNSPLQAVMSNEVWEEVYNRLAALITEHRTTLIFVNTRRLAERVARHLSERLGEENVTAHHGSLAREQRLNAEQRLKSGALRALVATASLELGIDIGDVDLVCQLGSTRSIATFLQRVGRSGHGVGGLPKGRIFPLSRDELVECVALLDAVRRGELDRLRIPPQPMDVLAQHIVAMVACEEWGEDALFGVVRRAWPYRDLAREDFNAVVRMLSEGFSTQRGRRADYLHRDAVNQRLRGRRGARLIAVTSGGAIPDNADYEVRLEPVNTFVGTVNEDFAVESLAGDIFQLGNASWRILRIEAGVVRVEDAHGQPPNIPFWLGEAPARTEELSGAVSRLRAEVEAQVEANGIEATGEWLTNGLGIARAAAWQMTEYLAAARAALGVMPTQETLVLERFFDESGGMQLVLHSPFGSRLNRAWGLALRKRFCRKFNFELQAAATEDAIVLSLPETHSFPLADVWHYLHSNSVRGLLVQALLAAPMFTTRWRWTASIALALPRFRGGRKVPPRLQRMFAEDLVAVVFPDQMACFENIVGEREVPDHPLVRQTLRDCLTEAMDIDGLEHLLRRIEQGQVRLVCRDLTEPSPLAWEILNARPYAFLDDAPLEERRTQAVMSRRWLDPETAADLGQLDPAAIERAKAEAWPEAETPDELHDALMTLGLLTEEEGRAEPDWQGLFEALMAEGRATVMEPAALLPLPPGEGGGEGVNSTTDPLTLTLSQRERGLDQGFHKIWVAAEWLPRIKWVYPQAQCHSEIVVPEEYAARGWSRSAALVELLRGRLEGVGPVGDEELARVLGLPFEEIAPALQALESEGFVLQGRFTPGVTETEWCERRLLARIHRYTLNRLRQEIEPVATSDFLRFLFRWQHLDASESMEGPQALAAMLQQLDGFEAPAAAWEEDILPARVRDYQSNWLDGLCLSGQFLWRRLSLPKSGPVDGSAAGPLRTTPIAFVERRNARFWPQETNLELACPALSPSARAAAEYLANHGASFFDDLVEALGLLKTQVENALGELVARGLVNSDSFSGLRSLITPSRKRRAAPAHGKRRGHFGGIEGAGRWTLARVSPQVPRIERTPDKGEGGPTPARGTDLNEGIEVMARALLRRYGVVFRRLMDREPALPPWRELLRVYRRLEARGEVRGGRFVAGPGGEQFALPEAVTLLREVRRKEKAGDLISISGADPSNLVGVLTPGARVPALLTNRILYRDGVPVAVQLGKDVQFLEAVDPAKQWELRQALVRHSWVSRRGAETSERLTRRPDRGGEEIDDRLIHVRPSRMG
jgi:ATP-dependent Lhr-like helicase